MTLNLLRANAVVGVKGTVSEGGTLTSVGVTCALCHSTVDDSLVPRHRQAARRLGQHVALDVGAILALSPALDAAAKAEFKKWGPGKYDPRHHYFDGAKIVPLNATFGADRYSRDLRPKGRRLRDRHRRWPDLLLERLRRHRPDGWQRRFP